MNGQTEQERLYFMSRLSYDAETGVFRWKNGCRAGRVAGGQNQKGRRQICLRGRTYVSARLAWLFVYGEWPAGQIDHRDLCNHNDAIRNLRVCNQSQNKANSNTYRNNLLRAKGVRLTKSDKYQSRIRKDGREYCLGTFETVEAATAAYADAAKTLFGEFARIS